VANLGVDGVGEVDGRGPAGQGLDLALGREAVDLLGIEVQLERVQELVGVLHLLLPLQQLAQPGEGLVVLVEPALPLLVLPVGGDALLRDAVHLARADLHLEGVPLVPDHRGVQRAVAVGPRHGHEVLDAAGHRAPQVVQDPEHRVAIGDGRHHDAQGHEVVHLVHPDALAAQLLVDGVEALDAPLQRGLQRRRLQLLRHRGLHLLDERGGLLAALLHLRRQVLVGLRFQVLEGQVLQLVLDLAHPEPPGQRRVDVHGLARDAHPAVVGEVAQRPHVVETVGQLDQDDADVVHHGQEQLAEVLGLPLLRGRERDLADLGHALHDVEDVVAEILLDALGVGEGVLQHVVEQAHRHAGRVHAHVGQDGRHLERMHEVRLARGAGLPLVLHRREDVGLPHHLEVGLGVVAPDGIEDVLEADHGILLLWHDQFRNQPG
jgi:hypothetical protein